MSAVGGNPRDRQFVVPKTSGGGGRAVSREEVMRTTLVRINPAWEQRSHRKLSSRTSISLNSRKMPLAAEGRKQEARSTGRGDC